MPNLTTNYDFYLPLVNNATDQDLWGGYLNDNWTSIDSLLKIASDVVVLSKTTTYSVVVADQNKLIICNATSGAITINLPAAATAGNGFRIYVKKTDATANAVTIDGSGSETIDGSTTLALSSRYNFAQIVCDGSNWHVIGLLRNSSATVPGVVELATAAETLTGTDDTRAITPDGFAGNNSLAADGYYKLPGGLIHQWGSQAATFNQSFVTISFPTSFTTACYSVVTQISMSATVSGSIGTVVRSIGTSSFQFAGDNSSDAGSGTVYWQAIGK
jgi:hypothetical protein